MRTLFIALALSAGTSISAQDNTERYIREGIDLHDRGYLEEAIQKYDSVLATRPTHYLAGYEKALTLTEMKRYPAAARLSRTILDGNPDSPAVAVYILYGSVLDYMNKSREAVTVYSEGIRRNPAASMLFFNRAVTHYGRNEGDEAEADLRRALSINPQHPGSHGLMARLHEDRNRVYALLASLTFLSLEPTGDRAKVAIRRVETVMGANVKKTGDKTISINLFLDPDEEKSKKKPDNFSSVEMFLGLSTALNYDDKYKNETGPERLKRNLEGVISSLSLHQKEGKGFAWSFYAPFLLDLQKAGHLDMLCHLAYASMRDDTNDGWLGKHKTEMEAFEQWVDNYTWTKWKD